MDDPLYLPHGRMDGNINPYTGNSITPVDPTTWGTATTIELYKQLHTLQNRMWAAQSIGKVDIVRQIAPFIEHLTAAIREAERTARLPPAKRRLNGALGDKDVSPTFD